MKVEDKRNKLDEDVFSYRILKDQKVFIYWFDQQVMILKDRDREKFLSKIERANAQEAQLIMAKITGNFKRGNEKSNKNS